MYNIISGLKRESIGFGHIPQLVEPTKKSNILINLSKMI